MASTVLSQSLRQLSATICGWPGELGHLTLAAKPGLGLPTLAGLPRDPAWLPQRREFGQTQPLRPGQHAGTACLTGAEALGQGRIPELRSPCFLPENLNIKVKRRGGILEEVKD